MSRLIFLCLLSLPLKAMAQDCDIDKTIASYEQYMKQQKTYKALEVIESSPCDHPRLELEKGSIFLSLGQPEKAQKQWMSVLDNYDLPNVVEKKIKLRILQSRLNPPAEQTINAAVAFDQQWDQQAISGVSLSGVFSSKLGVSNLAGYPLSHSYFAKVSGNVRYAWASDIATHATVVATGWRAQSKPFSFNSGIAVQFLSDDSAPYWDSALTWQWGKFSIQERFEVALNNQPHEWSQQISMNTASARIKLKSTAEINEEKLAWQSVSSVLEGTGSVRPGAQLRYAFESNEWEFAPNVRWTISPQSWLTASAGARLKTDTEWFASTSFTWRPF